jgi:hypothetical protein
VGEQVSGQRREPLRRRTDLKMSRHRSPRRASKLGTPPRLPDAAYEEIADALVAEAARMPSLGSSPGNATGLKAPKRTRGGRGAKGADREGWVAQARNPSLDATAGWTARARGNSVADDFFNRQELPIPGPHLADLTCPQINRLAHDPVAPVRTAHLNHEVAPVACHPGASEEHVTNNGLNVVLHVAEMDAPLVAHRALMDLEPHLDPSAGVY